MGNAFSDYGTFAHQLLEKWAKGELELWQLPLEWEAGYDQAMRHYFPPFMRGYDEKARLMGATYFAQFDGFPGYDVVSAERKFRVPIGDYEFDGIADLVLRDKNDGTLMVVDHKTKSAASMKKEMDTFRHQLYIYAEHVRQQYGEYPKTLCFNMLKSCELITEEFDPQRMDETIKWATETIDKICMDFTYESMPEDFHCRFLCDVRNQCPDCPIKGV